jgi:hypothetical protein
LVSARGDFHPFVSVADEKVSYRFQPVFVSQNLGAEEVTDD